MTNTLLFTLLYMVCNVRTSLKGQNLKVRDGHYKYVRGAYFFGFQNPPPPTFTYLMTSFLHLSYKNKLYKNSEPQISKLLKAILENIRAGMKIIT